MQGYSLGKKGGVCRRLVKRLAFAAFLFVPLAPLYAAEPTWQASAASMAAVRYLHTATLLPNGKVLITGGRDAVGSLSLAELYDPATGTFSATGSMNTARRSHTATLLPNGKVLVVGGTTGTDLSSAELYDPAAGTFSATGAMSSARAWHVAVLLPNGKVLVAGGYSGSTYNSSAELYDPAAGTFAVTGSMSVGRGQFSATLLPNGKVLLTGGDSTGATFTASVDLYDPAAGTFSATGPMGAARFRHSATLLPNGKVLIAGGANSGGTLSSAELYDPAAGTFSSTGSMGVIRQVPMAILLPNGKVLVTGGANASTALSSAELYDPAAGTFTATGSMSDFRSSAAATLLSNGKVLVTGGHNGSSAVASADLCSLSGGAGTFSATGSMSAARFRHSSTRLPNGKVLIVGGANGGGTLSSTELYNPATGAFSATGAMSGIRQGPMSILLPNGKVLVFGGGNASTSLSSAEIYDPAAGTFSATGSMGTGRGSPAAVLLPNGKVFVAGGHDGSSAVSSAELYDPAAGTFSATGSMSVIRYLHTATLLGNGKVLIVGGRDNVGSISSSELYDPATGTFSVTGSLAVVRRFHTATLLPDGKVLVAGGTGGPYLSSAELYDPAAGTFSATGSMGTIRTEHSALLLPSGKVLVAGGWSGTSCHSSAELYDPASGIFSAAASMNSARDQYSVTLLPSGKVLAAGGDTCGTTTSSADLYDTPFGGPDALSPGALSSLAVSSAGYVGGLALSWSEPGNDGASETLAFGSYFYVQYSTYSGVSWSTASAQVVQSTSGVAPSALVRYNLGGLDPGTTYYLAVWHKDESGNVSGLSNIASAYARPFPSVAVNRTVTGDGTWHLDFGPGPTGLTTGLALDAGGNIYAAGVVFNGANDDNFIHKYDASGNLLMAKYFNGADNCGDSDYPTVAVDTVTGSFYMAGGECRISPARINILIKYDASGQVEWKRTAQGNSATTAQSLTAVKLDSSGNVYVGGQISSAGDKNSWVRKYNSSGDVLWTSTKVYAPNYDWVNDLEVRDGYVYAAGSADMTDIGQGQNVTLWKLSANTGLTEWTTYYTGAANRHDDAIGLAVDSSGNSYLVGDEQVALNDYALMAQKRNSSGVIQWTALNNYTAPETVDEYKKVVLSTDNYLYEVGLASSSSQGKNCVVSKRDLNGNLLGLYIYDLAGGDDTGYKLMLNGDKLIFSGDETIDGQKRNFIRQINASDIILPDTTTPTAAILQPADGSVLISLSSVSGTASDDRAVSSVTVSIRNASLFWDGSVWAASRTWLDGAVFASSWTYSNMPLWVDGTTYTVNARAMDSSGNWSLNYATSTFHFELPAGCAFARTVKQAGGGDCSTIQACIDMIPAALTGDWCIDIQDSAAYQELPVVRNITTNGFRIILGALDAANRPSVHSNGLDTDAVIKIANSSVTVRNLIVNQPIGYNGILVSSPNAVVDQVFVDYAGQGGFGPGQINAAISISSRTTVTRSSISVNSDNGVYGCAGLKITGTGSVVSSLTVVGTGRDLGNAVWLYDASSNTITQSYISNDNCYGLTFGSNGGTAAHYNTVSYSTITSGNANGGCSGLHIAAGTYNNISRSYISNSNGRGVLSDTIDGPNSFSTIDRSTVAAAGPYGVALDMYESYSFTVSRSLLSSSSGEAVFMNGGSASISESTMTSQADGLSALYLYNPVDAAISDSYISGSSAAYVYGGSGVTISSSVLTGTGASAKSISLVNAANADLGSVTLNGGPLLWDGNSTVNISSVTFQGLQPGATAIDLVSNAAYVATFYGVNFADPDIAVNINGSLVDAAFTGSSITMQDSFGPRRGSPFENDPAAFIEWAPDLDLVPPSAAILQPQNNSYLNSLVLLAGTAADNVLVSSVQVGIMRQSDGYYWDGAAWAASESWLDAAVSAPAWSYAVLPAWANGASYRITAKAGDGSSNWSTVYSTSVFYYDNGVPVSAVSGPSSAAVLTTFSGLAGTAWDNESFAYQAEVKIRRISDGYYWDGAAWAASETWNLAVGSFTWTYTGLTEASLTNGVTYYAVSRASDTAGNVQTAEIGGSTFVYSGVYGDVLPPAVRIVSPIDSSYLTALSSITGTASDNVAVSSAVLSIFRNDTGLFWDGSQWSSGQAWLSAVLFPSSWTYSSIPALVSGSSYTVVSKARDSAANWSVLYSTSVFAYYIQPSAPSLSVPTVGVSSITWAWGDVLYETGYIVLSSSSGNMSGALAAGAVSWTETGLSANTTYTRLVEAFNISGSSVSAPLTRCTLALAPSSAVFSGAAYSSVAFSWEGGANPGTTLYQYELSLSSSFSVIAASGSVTAASAWVTGLTPGAAYYGRVRAVNGEGAPTVYNYVSPVVLLEYYNPPPTVSILQPQSYSYRNSLAALSGTAADDVLVSSVAVGIMRLSDGYYWNGAAWAAGESRLEASLSAPAWSLSTLPAWENGASYSVSAAAIDSAGRWSTVYSTSVFYFDTGLPASAVAIPASGATIPSFSGLGGTAWDAESFPAQIWVGVKRATDELYWNGASSQWAVAQAWNLAVGSATWAYAGLPEAELTSGTTYFAVSRVSDLAGNLQVSEALVSTFTYLVPPPPELNPLPFTAVAVSSLTVNWETTYGTSTVYYVRLSTLADAALPVFAATTTAASQTLYGLTPNTTYFGYVSTAAGSNYLLTDAEATLAAAPGAPAISARGDTSIALGWEAGGNPAGTVYQLWRDAGADFNNPVISTTTVSSHTVYGLAPGTQYFFKARAMNGDGVFSDFSADISTFTMPLLPAQPAAPAGSAAGISSITWTWAAVSGVTSYRVYAATAQSVLLASPSSPAYVQEGLSPNTTYSIVAAGLNASGEGPVSPAAVPVATLANMPSGVSISAVYATSATLTWGLNGNPAGTTAKVLRVNTATTFTTSGLNFTDTGLLGCTSYYFRVWNLNRANAPTQYEEAGPAFTASPTPLPPGNLSASSLSGYRIALSWEPAPFEGITGYNLYYDNGTGTINYDTPLASLTPLQTSYTTGMLSSVAYKFGLRALHRCGVEEKNTGVVASATGLYSLTGVRAAIKIPQSGKKVNGNSVTVMAELITGTVAETKNVRLQYKASSSATWLDIPAKDPGQHPNPDSTSPYFIHWDVSGLAGGSYDLRAIATDLGNVSDASPAAVTIAVDAAEADITENVTAGKVTKEQKVNNLVTNTLQSADPVSTQVTKLEIPAGALDASTATVSMTNNPAVVPPAPADAEPAGIVTEVTLSNQSLLAGGQTAAVTLLFPDADNDGIVDGTSLRASQLEMYSAHSAAGPWQRDLSSVVDLAGKKVVGYTTHFSFFALFAPQAVNINSARAYPVPWRPGSGGRFDSAPGTDGITFDNLTDKTEIKIYTVAGHLVQELKLTAADLGVKVWDGKNSAGVKAASGVYLAHIKSGSAVKVLKIAVER